MAQVVLLTGGNLGNVTGNMELAFSLIEQRIGKVTKASGIMESEAWGFSSDKKFLNQVLMVSTALLPEEVLDKAQEIEKQLGRTRTPDSGYTSRTMDIDILFYGNEIINTPRLTIPHPLMEQREFVLRPLAEIMPEFIHPQCGKSVAELLEALG